MKKVFLTLVLVLGLISLNPHFALAYAADGISIVKGETNGVHYMTGGVGLDERAVMKSMTDHYNVQLEFATNSGAYLADVRVLIQDGNNRTLVDKKSNGPWFFAAVPKGQYKITVIHAGKKETRQVVLAKALDTVIFNWKIKTS